MWYLDKCLIWALKWTPLTSGLHFPPFKASMADGLHSGGSVHHPGVQHLENATLLRSKARPVGTGRVGVQPTPT